MSLVNRHFLPEFDEFWPTFLGSKTFHGLLGTHVLRPFKQSHCASLGRGGVWLMMCASECVTEG